MMAPFIAGSLVIAAIYMAGIIMVEKHADNPMDAWAFGAIGSVPFAMAIGGWMFALHLMGFK